MSKVLERLRNAATKKEATCTYGMLYDDSRRMCELINDCRECRREMFKKLADELEAEQRSIIDDSIETCVECNNERDRKTCDGCKWSNVRIAEAPCTECSRWTFMSDKYEPDDSEYRELRDEIAAMMLGGSDYEIDECYAYVLAEKFIDRAMELKAGEQA